MDIHTRGGGPRAYRALEGANREHIIELIDLLVSEHFSDLALYGDWGGSSIAQNTRERITKTLPTRQTQF